MTRWTVELRPAARRQLKGLDEGPRRDALELIENLSEDPAMVPAVELRHYPGTWRSRFHHDLYRMIYQMAKGQRRVIVIRIRPRPIAYTGMKY